MLKKDVMEDDYSYISDSQLEQMEKLKPLIRRVLYKFTEYKDAPDSMNFFRADVYRYFFLLSFMCEYFENNEISQEHAISLVPQKFASRIKRLQVAKSFGFVLSICLDIIGNGVVIHELRQFRPCWHGECIGSSLVK